MCGIAGMISWDERQPVTENVLRAMAKRVAHRGPDGESVVLRRGREATAGMAFRRLAVLDCDRRAMQPMTTADKRFTLVFNGEIYNFRELQKRLPPREWKTTGDTEVLLACLAEWGPAIALERLDGMFAIALWDARDETLLLARDRMGQKPLYFSVGAGSMAFASELAALHEWPGWDRGIDDDALAGYLRYGYVLSPRTIYRGARQLEPGCCLVLRAPEPPMPEKVEHKRWFGLTPSGPAKPEARKPAQTRRVIEEAVRGQLVSDVPLGVFLSGGIDSSVMALCARKAGPVRTFSIGFDDPRYDETQYAEAVAKYLGTEHLTFRVTPDLADDLPKLAAVFGEPFGDSSALPTHWLSRQTRQHVTVALSGDGGDELFGGYDRYRAIGLPGAPLGPLASIGRRLERGHPKSQATRVGRLLAAAGDPPAQRYDRYVSLFDVQQTNALFGRDTGATQMLLYAMLIEPCGGRVEAALAYDRLTYLPGDLLTKVDRCSMLHALEVRSPFMDPDVLAYAATLRKAQLFRGGPKRLLREAFAGDLPGFVFKRRKSGFAVPIGDWFRASLRSMLHDTLQAADGFCRTRLQFAVVERLLEEHDTGRRDHGQRLYALLMLELWWRTAR
ncbi:MAG TPA: asparagine synthase (glutamine-hydrolyzing) [Tepidisphaeraceae bacterium]|jgi:asparagine synthase (glutamine-hydrolysing)